MLTVSVTSVGINDVDKWCVTFNDGSTIEFSTESDYVAYCSGPSLDAASLDFMQRLCASLVFQSSTNLGRELVLDTSNADGNIVKG